jgi:hypothetical protein
MLKRFQAKWRPVRVKKTRQIENLEPLLRLSKYDLEPVTVEETDYCQLMREFCADPAGFVEAVVEE